MSNNEEKIPEKETPKKPIDEKLKKQWAPLTEPLEEPEQESEQETESEAGTEPEKEKNSDDN